MDYPLALSWTTVPVQFLHGFTWGVKAWHVAQRYSSTLPELSEWWTLHTNTFPRKTLQRKHLFTYLVFSFKYFNAFYTKENFAANFLSTIRSKPVLKSELTIKYFLSSQVTTYFSFVKISWLIFQAKYFWSYFSLKLGHKYNLTRKKPCMYTSLILGVWVPYYYDQNGTIKFKSVGKREKPVFKSEFSRL